MKKIIIAAMLILLLCGCSGAAPMSSAEVATKYQGSFSAAARAEFDNIESEIGVEKNPMSISISILSPEELSGMEIEISDEHAKVTYEGMEQELDIDRLPEGTVFLLLDELFEKLSEPDEFTLSTGEEGISVKAEDFSAVLSKEDFSLISADFPFYGAEFFFSEFSFSEAE